MAQSQAETITLAQVLQALDTTLRLIKRYLRQLKEAD
jgi:hypothetical protein